MIGDKYRLDENLRKDWFLIIILLGLVIISFVIYLKLPERVPIHWNINGEIDGYGSRFTGAFAIPLLTIGIYIGMLLLPLIDPRKANYARFLTSYRVLRASLVIFLILIYGASTAAALGYNLNISRLVPIAVGILIMIIGNVLTHVRHNYFVGIRTPWTLASEEVWRKTHRIGGYIFVVAGLISVIAAFFPAPLNFWTLVGSLIGAALITTGYSVLVYFKYQRRIL